MKINIKDVEIDEDIYPRKKTKLSAVKSYVDKLKVGTKPPAILIQKIKTIDGEKEVERIISLDGRHRLESHELYNKESKETKEKIKKMKDEGKEIPKGIISFDEIDEIDAKYWKDEVLDKKENLEELRCVSLELNLQHGVPIGESDIAFQLAKIVEDRPIEKLTGIQKEFAKKFNLTEGRISQMVGQLVNKRKASRNSTILRLTLLGWTYPEITKAMGVKNPADAIEKFNIKEIYDSFQKGKPVPELASFYGLDEPTTWAIVLEGKTDQERFELLGFEPKVYDVWNYSECNKLMGQEHPGQIPGQIVLNTLYYYTKRGDLVVDLLAGGGVTNDACLLIGRKCYSYDINPVENRKDIIQHDFLNGLPERAKKSNLIFLDPPYFKKKEAEYGSESISALNREDYMKSMNKLAEICEGHRVAFVMGKYYDYEKPEEGIFMTEYVNIFEKHGFRQIDEISINQTPPEGGQHAVGQAKKKHRMEIIKRDLLILEA